MKKTAFHVALFVLFILASIMSACRSEIEPVSNGELHLTFTGDDCIYEGPTLLKAGPVTLHFDNQGDMLAAVNLMRHLEGKTIQDMIDYLGEEPFVGHQPTWVEDLETWLYINAGESLTWEGVLEPSVYSMVCGRVTGNIWYGTGLTVVE
jgi:hypothetical protein